MPRIFTSNAHNIDDTLADLAPELGLPPPPGDRLHPQPPAFAVVTGYGRELEASLRLASHSFHEEVWKIGSEELEYPNAELSARRWTSRAARQHRVGRALPFRYRPRPGLSIKLDAVFVSDVVEVTPPQGQRFHAGPPGIWRASQCARECDISTGAVLNFVRARSNSSRGPPPPA